MRRQLVRLALALGSCAIIAISGCAKKEVVKPEQTGVQEQQQQPKSPQTTQQPPTPADQQRQPVKEEPVLAQQVPETPPVREETPKSGDQTAPETLLQTVYFDFDSFVLSPTARDVLAKNAEYLKKNTGIRVQLEGHTDERGSDDYNLSLGEKRAKAAQSYLTTLGIEAGRLSIISYGEEKPADPAHTEEAWARNRRVEFVITK